MPVVPATLIFDEPLTEPHTEPAVNPKTEETRVVNGMCGICPAGCGVDVHVQNGRIVRVTPHADHPHNSACVRGMAAPEIVHAPDRLPTPLRRVGPKGSGQFEPISWDEAYDLWVAALLRVKAEYGAEAVCMYTGRGAFEQSLCDVYAPAGVYESSASSVLFPFGSPNTAGVGAICYVAQHMIAPQSVFGAFMSETFEDIDRSDLVVVWGTNPATGSSPELFRRILAAKRRGAQVISIDPLNTQTAKATGATWLPVRPGTDGALALAMLHVILAEGRYDHDFAEKWTLGFDELTAYVQNFPPTEVAHITGVPAGLIAETARRIAQAQGASFVMYTGLEYTNSGVQNIRAVFTLLAVAGHLDVPGGLVFNMPGAAFKPKVGQVPPPAHPQAIGRDRYPLYYHFRKEAHALELPKAILHNDPYPVRAMIVDGSSIITANPDAALWEEALASLDFLVVVDRFMTADAQYADLILPATTMFEIASYKIHNDHVQVRERVISPVGEARNDYLIFAELAQRLGYGHFFPQSEEALLEAVFADAPVSLAEVRAHPGGVPLPQPPMIYRKWEQGLLRPDGQPGFNTPSGKFEIASNLLAEYGYDPLPIYAEPAEGPLSRPDLARTYPLVLTSGARVQSDFRSQHHNIPSLLKRQVDPLVILHPGDAAQRGIESGDVVRLMTERGSVTFVAKVSPDVRPGTVEANMGGGSPTARGLWREANINRVTDAENRDPLSGFPVYKALLCEVERIA